MKIRINELARELEVKPQRILELLPELGVVDKKTHSSSVDDEVVNKVRGYYGLAPLSAGQGQGDSSPSNELDRIERRKHYDRDRLHHQTELREAQAANGDANGARQAGHGGSAVSDASRQQAPEPGKNEGEPESASKPEAAPQA
ncbi:MAG TPA: translation initiation factor IF-2 N-terminal domain-containing protein, partial [Bryobacteraceae bacterium]